MYRIYFILFLCISLLNAEESHQTLPVAYNGRFLPLDVYARLKLQEFYGKQQLKKNALTSFNLQGNSALSFFLKLYFDGSKQFDNSPFSPFTTPN